MPALGFLAVAGSVLVALLFLADATLEKSDSPVIATSQRSGLPEPSPRSGRINILTTAPAPTPDMTLQAVRDAQPKPDTCCQSGSAVGSAITHDRTASTITVIGWWRANGCIQPGIVSTGT